MRVRRTWPALPSWRAHLDQPMPMPEQYSLLARQLLLRTARGGSFRIALGEHLVVKNYIEQ